MGQLLYTGILKLFNIIKTFDYFLFSQPSVQQHVKLTDPIEVMGAIRREKDDFKPK